MRLLVAALIAGALWAGTLPALALDKVTFGTNWKAEAEHGGFYQAVADGTYERYGLDVTIRQGGPQVNHSQLLAAGKIDFNMGGNLFEQFNFTAEQRADGHGRGRVPEGPAGADRRTRTPGSRASRT